LSTSVLHHADRYQRGKRQPEAGYQLCLWGQLFKAYCAKGQRVLPSRCYPRGDGRGGPNAHPRPARDGLACIVLRPPGGWTFTPSLYSTKLIDSSARSFKDILNGPDYKSVKWATKPRNASYFLRHRGGGLNLKGYRVSADAGEG
jgi:hypothetical protein